MAVSGVTGVPAKVQIPLAINENTPTEERRESQVQKAAEQMKANAAKILSPSPNGVGQAVNLKA